MGIFSRNGVSVTEAAQRLADGAVLLDVRTKNELREGAARDAMHISLDSLPKRFSRLGGKEVYVICRSGNRSRHAVSFLRQQGIDAFNVRGGMIAWRRANLPLATNRKGARR